MRDISIGAIFALLMALLPAALLLMPREGASVAVFVAPWAAAGDAARVVAVANGMIIDSRGPMALAQSPSPDFADQLYRAGAVLVIDGAAVGACLGIAVTQLSTFAPETTL